MKPELQQNQKALRQTMTEFLPFYSPGIRHEEAFISLRKKLNQLIAENARLLTQDLTLTFAEIRENRALIDMIEGTQPGHRPDASPKTEGLLSNEVTIDAAKKIKEYLIEKGYDAKLSEHMEQRVKDECHSGAAPRHRELRT